MLNSIKIENLSVFSIYNAYKSVLDRQIFVCYNMHIIQPEGSDTVMRKGIDKHNFSFTKRCMKRMCNTKV